MKPKSDKTLKEEYGRDIESLKEQSQLNTDRNSRSLRERWDEDVEHAKQVQDEEIEKLTPKRTGTLTPKRKPTWNGDEKAREADWLRSDDIKPEECEHHTPEEIRQILLNKNKYV